jgi:hypothetical protein
MENAEYVQLCKMTDELFAKHGSRPRAFRAACAQRPDLAARAIYPTGRPVVPGSKASAPAAGKDPAGQDPPPWNKIVRKLNGAEEKAPAAEKDHPAGQEPSPWNKIVRKLNGRVEGKADAM